MPERVLVIAQEMSTGDAFGVLAICVFVVAIVLAMIWIMSTRITDDDD